MIRRIAPLATTAIAAVVLGATPAHAEGEIGLSYDGTTWANELSSPLFDDAFRWIPGDVEEASFLVRNDGPSAGELSVAVLATDPDGLLSSDAFDLEARIGTGDWVDIAGGTTALAPAVMDIAQGANTRVTVRGTFSPDSTVHEDEIAPFIVRVTLSEDGDVGGVDNGGGDGNGGGDVDGVDNGVLPDTGSPFSLALIWGAAGLIGAGIALVRPRRDRSMEVAGG